MRHRVFSITNNGLGFFVNHILTGDTIVSAPLIAVLRLQFFVCFLVL